MTARRKGTWALFECPDCGHRRQYAIGGKTRDDSKFYPYWYPWCPRVHYAPVTGTWPMLQSIRYPRRYVGMRRRLVMVDLTPEQRAEAVAAT